MTDVIIQSHFGRPTKYKPEFCNLVVEYGKLGKSKAWICSELEIADNTMRTWCDEYPDFLQAMDVSQKYSQRWWEDAGQNGMLGKTIDASIWSRSMAARFPNDWRESNKVEHSGKIDVITKEQRDAAVAAASRANT
jgi:hypothetical protein